MPRLICAPIKLIRKEIQVAIIEELAQGSLGFSPLIREVGEERGGRGGSLPSSPSDRERRVGSSHGLNWAPIPASHTHTQMGGFEQQPHHRPCDLSFVAQIRTPIFIIIEDREIHYYSDKEGPCMLLDFIGLYKSCKIHSASYAVP